MTEQEYEKLVSAAAFTELYKFTAGGTIYEEDHFIKGFLAAIKWSRENPPPEVQELIQALIMVCHEWDAPEVYQSQISEALARFKERMAGKGEG